MIKRDTIQRYTTDITEDEMGGSVSKLVPKENVVANVSIGTVFSNTEYGTRNELTLNVVTNVELDKYLYTRYMYSGKLFKLVRQIKQGNEYFSTLVEVNDEEVNANAYN